MRPTRTISFAAVLAAAVLTAGCSGSAGPDPDHLPDTTPPAAAPTPTPTADEEEDATFGERVVNDRGNLVKEIGQLAGMTLGDDDVMVAQFVATEIAVDIACTSEWADPPKNGHFVGIHLNVETTPELANDDIGTVSFSQWAWQAFDADGKRVNDPMGNASWCMDTGDLLPGEIGPAQSVSGWVVLDLTTDHGAVAYTLGGSTGWEWAY